MKKRLIAAAIAVGFAGTVAAQTSLTLYGTVDGGIGHTQYKLKNVSPGVSDKASRTGGYNANQSDSSWGLRGSEDLGGGLHVDFQLESGVDLFTGEHDTVGKLFSLEAWMGLSGDDWGALRYGRQQNFASRYVADVVGVYEDAFGEGHIGASFTSTAGVRYDNMIAYESPEFNGFQFGIGYSLQDDGSQPWRINSGVPHTDRTAWTTALRYSNGSLTLAASYDVLGKRDDNPNGILGGEKAVKSWAIGASYDFEVFRLHLGFGQDKDGVLSDRGDEAGLGAYTQDTGYLDVGGLQGGYKTNNYAVGVALPVGAAQELSVNWQAARLGSGLYKDDVHLNHGKTTQNLYSVVYTYEFSPRTNLYAFATHGTGYAFNDMTVNQVVVGLRHQF